MYKIPDFKLFIKQIFSVSLKISYALLIILGLNTFNTNNIHSKNISNSSNFRVINVGFISEISKQKIDSNPNNIRQIPSRGDSYYYNKNSNTLVNSLSHSDVFLVKDTSGMIDLVIKHKPGIQSVMLTNFYWKDNSINDEVYSLRSKGSNYLNINEKRSYLTCVKCKIPIKKIISNRKAKLFFLVDSTLEKYNENIGNVFRIRLPEYMVYGYNNKVNSMFSMIRLVNYVKMNIRAFRKPYADYTGDYFDVPIQFVSNDSYYSNDPRLNLPRLSVSKRYKNNDNYYTTQLRYNSYLTYFKAFMIKELPSDYTVEKYPKLTDNITNFNEISFTTGNKPIDLMARVVKLIYHKNVNKVLDADMYFKLSEKNRVFQIIAVDKNDKPTNSVIVKVPSLNEVNSNNFNIDNNYECVDVECKPNEHCLNDPDC